MTTLITILGLACFAHLLVDFLQELDIQFFQQKPFNCELCMGFWLSIGILCGMHGWIGIPMAAITGVLADVIYRWKGRL